MRQRRGEPQTIDEYINSSTATFQTQLFEATGLSETNEPHTIVLTTVAGERGNFNFDYFEVISVDESSVDDTVQSPGNTTYYLDSSAPADGLSAEAAFDSLEDVNNVTFAPGDKIMIKAGSEFRGQLYPKGSGSADAPIVIDMYGEGEKPLIDGDGRYSDAPTFRDTVATPTRPPSATRARSAREARPSTCATSSTGRSTTSA